MVVVVTGCSRGIGFELAKALSIKNKVYGISRNKDLLDDLRSESECPENLYTIDSDVSKIKKANIDNWITDKSVDVLINNAGFLINKPFTEQTFDDYRKIMDINFFGVVNMSQLLLPKLSKAKGQIVNIGSIGGLQGTSKYPGLSMYSSSKGAVSILTECLALELASFNVKVNGLALGGVQTEMLSKAFPGYEAKITASQMANYIINFIENGSKLSNGLVLPVTLTNP